MFNLVVMSIVGLVLVGLFGVGVFLRSRRQAALRAELVHADEKRAKEINRLLKRERRNAITAVRDLKALWFGG